MQPWLIPFSTHRRRTRLVLLILAASIGVWVGRQQIAEIPRMLSRSAIHHRQPESAVQWLEWAEWIGGSDSRTELLKARCARKLGQWAGVREHLLNAERLGGSIQAIQREDWLARAQSGQLRDVERRRDQMLLDPGEDTEEICEAFSLGYLMNRRFDECVQLLESWSADYPENPQPHYLMGLLLGEQKKFAAAAKSLEKAIVLEPDYFEARLSLANALLTDRRQDEAMTHFEHCRRLQDHPEVWLGLARCQFTFGELPEARRNLEAGLQKYPENFKLNLELGRHTLNDDFQVAHQHLEKAVRIEPDSLEAHYLLGQVLIRLGRRSDAEPHLEFVNQINKKLMEMQKLLDAVALQPNDVEARFQIGLIKLHYESEIEGLQWLQSVLNLEPQHQGAAEQLALYYENKSKESPLFSDLAKQYRKLVKPPNN